MANETSWKSVPMVDDRWPKEMMMVRLRAPKLGDGARLCQRCPHALECPGGEDAFCRQDLTDNNNDN